MCDDAPKLPRYGARCTHRSPRVPKRWAAEGHSHMNIPVQPIPSSTYPGERARGRHRAPQDLPSGAPGSGSAQVPPTHSAAIAALLIETGPVPRDLRPPHPSGPVPVVRDLRPPHPSGPMPIVGAPPMSTVPSDVTDDQIQAFLAQAAELRRATGPVRVIPPAQPMPAAHPAPAVRPARPAAGPAASAALPAAPVARPATSPARPAPGVAPRPRTTAGGGAVSRRPPAAVVPPAQEQRLREFSRPTRAWSQPGPPSLEPPVPSPDAVARPTFRGTPPPVPATDVTRAASAAPATHPTFLELIRGDDIVRVAPAGPAREPRRLLPHAASLLGDRAVAERDGSERTRRGPSRAAGILAGIAVVMTGIAVSSTALPARTSAERPARVLTDATVALTQSDLVTKASTPSSGHAAGGPDARPARAASPRQRGALLAAFATPAPTRTPTPTHSRVMATGHSATATSSARPHRSSAPPSVAASAPSSPSASPSAPAASASASLPAASSSASPSASTPAVSPSVSPSAPPVAPSASVPAGTPGLSVQPGS
jgi:hypothetical protein